MFNRQIGRKEISQIGGSLLSCRGISFISTKEKSKPRSFKGWILLVLLITTLIYIFKSQSTQLPTPTAEKLNSVAVKGFEFVQNFSTDVISILQSLVAYGLPSVSSMINSFFLSVAGLRIQSQKPFLVDIALMVLFILFFILCLFAIYSICRLFLFLSDRSIHHEHTGFVSPERRSIMPSDRKSSITHSEHKTSTVIQSDRRPTVTQTEKSAVTKSERGRILAPSKRKIIIPFSEKPFVELRKLCHTNNSQTQYNALLDVYMKSN